MRKQNLPCPRAQIDLINGLVRPHQDQKQASCLEIFKNQKLQLKDYTWCERKNIEGLSTWDLDEFEEKEESNWGFPRPCQVFQSSIREIYNDQIPFWEKPSTIFPNETITEEKGLGLNGNLTTRKRQSSSERQQKKNLINVKSRGEKLNKIPAQREEESDSESEENSSRPGRKRKQIRKKRVNPRQTSLSPEKLNQLKRLKNETKNTVKNYGKEIIKFIHDNRTIVERALAHLGSDLSYENLDERLQEKKNSISRIKSLLQLWTNEEYGKILRVITDHFLRKHCYHYIFNSRVQNIPSMLKYKKRIHELATDPWNETSLKFE